jgi:hypothetical protein
LARSRSGLCLRATGGTTSSPSTSTASTRRATSLAVDALPATALTALALLRALASTTLPPVLLLFSRLEGHGSRVAGDNDSALATLLRGQRLDDGLSGRLDLGELDERASSNSDNLDGLDLSEPRRVRLDLVTGKRGIVRHAISRPVRELQSAFETHTSDRWPTLTKQMGEVALAALT